MYRSFFRLTADPFGATPNPEFLSITPQVQEALAALEYAVRYRKGIAVLTGEVGTGKTTLLRTVLHRLRDAHIHFAYVFNPRLEILDFLEFVLADFGLHPPARTKAAMLTVLNRWLIECYGKGEICVLLVDEAQECTWELLEEIRLLTNLETSSQKLLQVVLSGQPEFEEKLRAQNARQLLQRVVVWGRTEPLSLPETQAYIRSRLQFAGATRPIFTDDAIARVHELSGGIPRMINLLCEHSLILGYVRQQATVDAALVEGGSSDLVLSPFRSSAPPPPVNGTPAATEEGHP